MYKCIIADPPWQYDDKMAAMKTTGNGASSQYKTMPFVDICSFLEDTPASAIQQEAEPFNFSDMALNDVIAEDAHLWLWITNPFLVGGYGNWLIDKWGFTPKTMATWVKGRLVVRSYGEGADVRRNRRIGTEIIHDADDDVLIVEPDFTQHYGQGHYLRGTTEHCILAVRGNCQALVHDLPNAFIYPGRWSGRLHSEKPPVIHEWAERLSPGPRLELFARRGRTGWDAVGDELCDNSTSI